MINDFIRKIVLFGSNKWNLFLISFQYFVSPTFCLLPVPFAANDCFVGSAVDFFATFAKSNFAALKRINRTVSDHGHENAATTYNDQPPGVRVSGFLKCAQLHMRYIALVLPLHIVYVYKSMSNAVKSTNIASSLIAY